MKRIASLTVIIHGKKYVRHVVELSDDGKLINHYPLTHELPNTEWTQETLIFDNEAHIQR